MKLKNKMLLIVVLVCLLAFSTGITYSFFFSSSKLDVEDQKIAKFIFNSEKLDHLELNPSKLVPGNSEEYNFSITNNSNENISNVTLNYQIIIKTFHFMPLNIELYKINGDQEELIMNCDETYSRNENNELVCNSKEQEMKYNEALLDQYKIKVTFPKEYNSDKYSELVDYIDVEVKSWQKVAK